MDFQFRAPTNSPDQNPIELLWTDLKRYFRARKCRNLDELRVALRAYWRSLTPEKCAVFIGSLRELK